MAPGVTCATTWFFTVACWCHVSGESSIFLSRRSSNTVLSGASVALSEEGYRQVVSLKSDEQMNAFILRILHKDGLEGNTSYLQGLIPWYSGTRAVQSLARLREELIEQPWVRRISQASSINKNVTIRSSASGDVLANVFKNLSAHVNLISERSSFTKNESSELHAEKAYIKTKENSSFISKNVAVDMSSVSSDVSVKVSRKVWAIANSTSAQSAFKKNAPIELHAEKAHIQAADEEEGTSSRACLAQCYTGHRAKASWKEDKCNHQHCYRCPECDVRSPSAQSKLINSATSRLRGGSSAWKNLVATLDAPHELLRLEGNLIQKNTTNHLYLTVASTAVGNANASAAAPPGLNATSSRKTQIMSQENVQKNAFPRHCKRKCYGPLRAMLSWKDQKCFWNYCDACPECGGELRTEKQAMKAEDKETSTSSRVCLAHCYTGKRANLSWKKQKCHHERCSGCRECDAKQPAQELSPPKGSQLHDQESRANAENKETGTPTVASEAQRLTGKRAHASRRDERNHDHRNGRRKRDTVLTGQAVVSSKIRQAKHHTGDRANHTWKNAQHWKRRQGHRGGRPTRDSEPHAVFDEHPHYRQHPKKTAGVVKTQEASHSLAVDTPVESAGKDAIDNIKTTARGMMDVIQETSIAASSMFSGFFGMFNHAEPIADAELGQPDPLAGRQVEPEKPVKRAQLSNNKIQTMSARMLQGDETHENRSFERKTMAIVATPDASSQAVTMARAAEAREPEPSFETDLVGIPYPETLSKAEVSAGSRPAPQFSKKSKQVNVADAQPQFASKVAAAVVVDSTSTPREPDESIHDTLQPSESRLLPEVTSLLDKSKHALAALNEHVNTLKEQVAEAESESQQAVASKKFEYERTLEQQIENSTFMATSNEELGRETQKLREQNVELRKRARQLEARGAQLHKLMLGLKTNLTLAQEYIEGVLESHSNDSAALFVLRQLDEQDATLAKSKAHASALQQVSSALLQTSSRTESADAFEVIRNLKENFDDLDREKAASMAALRHQFEDQFSKGLQRQGVLKEERRRLKADRDGQLALREKLQAAVNYLQHAVSSLEHQIQGLQAYADRLSSTR